MPVLRVRGKVTNVHRVETSLERAAQAMDSILDHAMNRLGSRSVEILRSHAPKGRSGQLDRGIKARRRGTRGVDVTVHAVAPESGYDYAAVTRFGHRTGEIRPTEGRKALKIRFQGGNTEYRHNVRGFHPAGDWVDKAGGELDVLVDEVAKEVGGELELRLFS